MSLYTPQDYGIIPGSADWNAPLDINSQGWIVGASMSEGGDFSYSAFIHDDHSIRGIVGLDQEVESIATGINDGGLVAGYSWFEATDGRFKGQLDCHAWFYAPPPTPPPGPHPWELHFLSLKGTRAVASGINNSGQIVGRYLDDNDQSFWTFLWTPKVPGSLLGSITKIARSPYQAQPNRFVYPNPSDWNAASINDFGQVCGSMEFGQDSSHAFLWTPNKPNGPVGQLTDLDNSELENYNSHATAINAKGAVVGISFADRGQTSDPGLSTPFRWTPSSPNSSNGIATEDLGNFNTRLAYASDINASGQIVGWAGAGSGSFAPPRAFVFDNGVSTDLNTRFMHGGYDLLFATAINDVGMIAGVLDDPNSRRGWRHSILLTPVLPRGHLIGRTPGHLIIPVAQKKLIKNTPLKPLAKGNSHKTRIGKRNTIKLGSRSPAIH